MNMEIMPIEAIKTTEIKTFTPSLSSSNAIADFGQLMTQGIDALNHSISAAESQATGFALGESMSTHDLMISMEKARFSLQVAVEIRNRLVESYQELTRMQI